MELGNGTLDDAVLDETPPSRCWTPSCAEFSSVKYTSSPCNRKSATNSVNHQIFQKNKNAENLIRNSQVGLSFERAREEDASDEDDDEEGLERRNRDTQALSKRSARARSWSWIWALDLDSSARMNASHEAGEARQWTKLAWFDSPSHADHTPQLSSFLASS